MEEKEGKHKDKGKISIKSGKAKYYQKARKRKIMSSLDHLFCTHYPKIIYTMHQKMTSMNK